VSPATDGFGSETFESTHDVDDDQRTVQATWSANSTSPPTPNSPRHPFPGHTTHGLFGRFVFPRGSAELVDTGRVGGAA